MLVADIVRRVRETAGDIGVLQFSNATLTDWINDGIRECVIANSLLQARATSNAVVNQQEYNLPADIYKIHSITFAGRKLEIITLEQWEARYAGDYDVAVATGSPTVGYVFAGILNLYPVPDVVKPIVINYTKTPATITYTAPPAEAWNPSTPSIPEAFHSRIVTFCLAQVALQDDDFAKYQALMQEFQTGMRELHDTKNEDDLYPFINTSLDDGGW